MHGLQVRCVNILSRLYIYEVYSPCTAPSFAVVAGRRVPLRAFWSHLNLWPHFVGIPEVWLWRARVELVFFAAVSAQALHFAACFHSQACLCDRVLVVPVVLSHV